MCKPAHVSTGAHMHLMGSEDDAALLLLNETSLLYRANALCLEEYFDPRRFSIRRIDLWNSAIPFSTENDL